MEMINERIEIPHNKIKIIKSLFVLFFAFILFIFFIYNILLGGYTDPEVRIMGIIFSNNELKIISCICVVINIYVFFLIITHIRMILSKKSGLIIDKTGITDNCLFNMGHILWNDITDIQIAKKNIDNINLNDKVFYKTYLLILINNPDKYIKRQKNPYLRVMAKRNYKVLNTPICLRMNMLQCTQNELKEVLLKHWEKWKK